MSNLLDSKEEVVSLKMEEMDLLKTAHAKLKKKMEAHPMPLDYQELRAKEREIFFRLAILDPTTYEPIYLSLI